MASKITSLLLARLLLVSIVLGIAGQAVATRNIPKIPNNDGQMKHAEWLIGHDSRELIPGLGRGMLPPVLEHHNPFFGSTGGSTDGTPGYIPGGDDTFVPNPGFEVPIPGNGASGAAKGTHQHP